MTKCKPILFFVFFSVSLLGCLEVPPDGLPSGEAYGECIFGWQWGTIETAESTVCSGTATVEYRDANTDNALLELSLVPVIDDVFVPFLATFQVPRAGLDPEGTFPLLSGVYGELMLVTGSLDLGIEEVGVDGFYHLESPTGEIVEGRFFGYDPNGERK